MKTKEDNLNSRVRLDKWLWAARFFKTRSLAKTAIEGGKVHYNGQRSKVGKEVELDAEIVVRQGWDAKTIIVKALSDRRGPALEAQKLYIETDASKQKREQNALERRASNNSFFSERPNKKERRQIQRFQSVMRELE